MTITWLFGGVWHGAAYHFVAWGVWQAVMIIIHREFSGLALSRWLNEKGGLVWDVFARILTMFSLGFGFVMFRAEDMDKAWQMMRKMLFTGQNVQINSWANSDYGLLLGLVFAASYYFNKRRIGDIAGTSKIIWMILACFFMILVFGVPESQNFLYFAF